MYITLSKLLNPVDAGVVVEFESEFGIGRGIWRFRNPEPRLECGYVVEMDILDDVVLGKSLETV